jgi:ribosomal-protein-alanine N-acetyltransferase
MINIDFSIFPLLYTERLLLKEITENDAQTLFEMRSDQDLMKYIDRPKPDSIDDIYDLIQKMKTMKSKGEGISWGIFKKEQPDLKIGNIGLYRIIAEHYRAEIGYMLNTANHQQGIMYEAILKVIEFGFMQMNLHSIEANINPENIASRKLLEKTGFVREAYFKENYFFNGKFIDSEIYSLLNKRSDKFYQTFFYITATFVF